MAYDRALAARLRALISDEGDLTEKAMFGGLAFLVAGHMAVAASAQGGLLVRADPAAAEALVVDDPRVRPMEMRGRPMRGWLHVPAEAVEARRELARWAAIGVGSARSLPPKAVR